MKSMANGDPVDIQREARWPNRTGENSTRGVKVAFHPWEENSDYSDEEGLIQPFKDAAPPATEAAPSQPSPPAPQT